MTTIREVLEMPWHHNAVNADLETVSVHSLLAEMEPWMLETTAHRWTRYNPAKGAADQHYNDKWFDVWYVKESDQENLETGESMCEDCLLVFYGGWPTSTESLAIALARDALAEINW